MADWLLALIVLLAGGIGSSGKDLWQWIFGSFRKEDKINSEQKTEILLLQQALENLKTNGENIIKIQGNELVHLKSQIDIFEKDNEKEHLEIKVMLAKICQKLEIV